MSFDQRELAVIGHWSSTSRMPERYDRSVCASELLLRTTTIQQIVAGWGMAPAYQLPTTVNGRVRIGKPLEQGATDPPATQAPGNDREGQCANLALTQAMPNSQLDPPQMITRKHKIHRGAKSNRAKHRRSRGQK